MGVSENSEPKIRWEIIFPMKITICEHTLMILIAKPHWGGNIRTPFGAKKKLEQVALLWKQDANFIILLIASLTYQEEITMVGENVHINFDVLFQCVLFNLLDSCNMFHSWRYPGFAYAPRISPFFPTVCSDAVWYSIFPLFWKCLQTCAGFLRVSQPGGIYSDAGRQYWAPKLYGLVLTLKTIQNIRHSSSKAA